MDEREYRTVAGPIGAGLFVSGWVVTSEWVFAAEAALPARHFALLAWPLFLGLALMSVGLYVFAAAFIPHWWLPGKPAVWKRQEQERVALEYLAKFRSIFTVLDAQRAFWSPTQDELTEWRLQTAHFVDAAFGRQWLATVFVTRPATTPTDLVEMFRGAEQGLGRLVESSHAVPVRASFTFGNPDPEWKTYCDGWFKDTLPALVQRMGAAMEGDPRPEDAPTPQEPQC